MATGYRCLAILWAGVLAWCQLSLCLPADQVDLAKIRREEQKRREKAGKVVMVLTDQGVVYRKATPEAQSAGRVSQLPGQAASSQEEGPEEGVKGEQEGEDWLSKRQAERKVWQERITTARDELSRAESRVRDLQLELNRLSSQLLIMDLPMRRKALADEVEKRRQELEQARVDQVRIREAYEKIPQEARRQGVPPGWLR